MTQSQPTKENSDPSLELSLSTIEGMDQIEASAWDACANPPGQPSNPFVKHSFLKALEDSGSVGPGTGWQPLHAVVKAGDGQVVGCAPLYAKSHSYGEYVFDWAWADAYQRAGGDYYPKLLCAAPFTPASGPRLLARGDVEGLSADRIRSALVQALVQVCQGTNTSSLHINFPTAFEADFAQELGLMKRVGLQFHWHNNGYNSFDDFLAALNSRKRKAVKKERKEAAATGLDIRRLQGSEISEAHWDAFFRFYMNTSDRKWGSAYLTREFFSLIDAQDVVLVMCFDGTRPVAGALNMLGGDCLYGRNWGCDEDYKMLHFEACYYQAIEYAIEHKLPRVEAGAQGHHKLQRGYLPQPTYSLHWIKDPGLDEPIKRFVTMEAQQVEAEIAGLTEQESPYRKAEC